MIIAIDGPAASGKGTLGRRLAGRFGLRHLDTGLLYRGVAAALIEGGLPIDAESLAIEMARTLRVERLDAERLAAPEVGEAASKVAVMPGLRAALIDLQRTFAAASEGAVLDGRDIGTVICPEADVKIFLSASQEVRATRRASQLGITDAEGILGILEDIRRRDDRDIHRAAAPLRQASDAHLLETSQMDIEAAFRAAVDIIENAVRRRIPAG